MMARWELILSLYGVSARGVSARTGARTPREGRP